MVQIVAGFAMAGPMFVVGFELLRTGSPLFGVLFFALGLLALYFPTWLIRRIGGPRTWIKRRLSGRNPSIDSNSGQRDN